MRIIVVVVTVFFLISCTAPKPKTVSGKKRVAINTEAIYIPQPAPKPVPAVAVRPDKPILYTFNFEFESTRLSVPDHQLATLLAHSLSANKIQIRGRTDNTYESSFDENIAKGRAVAARDILVRNGVNPRNLDVNFSSASDYVAENVTPQGRAKNRRVEILIF